MNTSADSKPTWFVLRDLTRPIAKLPGYLQLSQQGFEVFTPMKWTIREAGGRQQRIQIPVIHDLLFVHSTREKLDPVIDKTNTASDGDQRVLQLRRRTEQPHLYGAPGLEALHPWKRLAIPSFKVRRGTS